jgi:hypothetical protein
MLIPWDPFWKYCQNKRNHSKKLAKAYLELQTTIEEISKNSPFQRYWYELGDTVILESSGYQDQILDRIFLEGKQRDIWLYCKDLISSKRLSELVNVSIDSINEFLLILSGEGFIFGEQNSWTHAALNQTKGKLFNLRNVKSRPATTLPKTELKTVNLNRYQID